jgi:hypothetical protein
MQWFVQTPEHSFKNTLGHSMLVDVFAPGAYHSEYTRFHAVESRFFHEAKWDQR